MESYLENSKNKYKILINYMECCFQEDINNCIPKLKEYIPNCFIWDGVMSSNLDIISPYDLKYLPEYVNLISERDLCLKWLRQWSNLSTTVEIFTKGLPGIERDPKFEGLIDNIYKNLCKEEAYDLLNVRYLSYCLLEK